MSPAKWKLVYWPIAGRGEFIRLIFEFAQVPFEEDNKPQEYGFGGGGSQATEAKGPSGFPSYAVPFVENKETGFRLSQTNVICKYLGEQFGLVPKDGTDATRAEQVNVTIHDFIGEGRLAFHGKNFYQSYYPQQEDTKPYIEYFVANRLPRFLNHFEQLLEWAASNGNKYTFGYSVTYVDLALLHVLRATASQFPNEWKDLLPKYPKLAAFKSDMEALPPLAAYFKLTAKYPEFL